MRKLSPSLPRPLILHRSWFALHSDAPLPEAESGHVLQDHRVNPTDRRSRDLAFGELLGLHGLAHSHDADADSEDNVDAILSGQRRFHVGIWQLQFGVDHDAAARQQD